MSDPYALRRVDPKNHVIDGEGIMDGAGLYLKDKRLKQLESRYAEQYA